MSDTESQVEPEVIRGKKNIAEYLGMSQATLWRLLRVSPELKRVLRRDELRTWIATREDLLEYVRSRRSAS